jgi:antitoxin MazE
MQTTVQKWGNSLAVRIPAAFADQLNITVQSRVNMRLEGKELVVAVVMPLVQLDDLLVSITDDNLHDLKGMQRG